LQANFSVLEYGAKKRKTRCDRFFAEIEAITLWAALLASIEPFYPKGGARGRPPIGLDKMPRMYIAKQCVGSAYEAIDDALDDSHVVRRFVGVDIACCTATDQTALLKFRRLFEENKVPVTIFENINEHPAAEGLMVRGGQWCMRQSLPRPRRPRTVTACAIRRCTKRRRVANCTLVSKRA
jgi:IS5 family transposase